MKEEPGRGVWAADHADLARTSRRFSAHFAAADVGPLEEAAQAGALAPEEAEKGAGVRRRGFRAEECFHAPADIGAAPGAKAIAFGGGPVKSQGAEHVLRMIPAWGGEAKGMSVQVADRNEKMKPDSAAPGLNPSARNFTGKLRPARRYSIGNYFDGLLG